MPKMSEKVLLIAVLLSSLLTNFHIVNSNIKLYQKSLQKQEMLSQVLNDTIPYTSIMYLDRDDTIPINCRYLQVKADTKIFYTEDK
jgi:hypothetical protein